MSLLMRPLLAEPQIIVSDSMSDQCLLLFGLIQMMMCVHVLQASCSEFHMSHGAMKSADPIGPSTSANGGSDSERAQALWLIKSPSGEPPPDSPGGTGSSQQVTPLLPLP